MVKILYFIQEMNLIFVLIVSFMSLNFIIGLCPPLKKIKKLTTTCYGPNRTKTECNNNTFPVNSVVEFKCKQFYKPVGPLNWNYKRITCLPNGHWSGEELRCKAECGNAFPASVVPLILRGWNVIQPSWPWHISIFAFEDDKWELTCGASLVTEKAAITAAHCVWKQVPNKLKIAAAKYTRDYADDKPETQIRDVERVFVHPLYEDIEGNYASDIAILVFQEPLSFSISISPVCLNWDFHNFNENEELNNGELLIGTVIGMGVTENDRPSTVLEATALLVVGGEQCKESQDPNFRKFVTLTVFCAGWLNGSAVCNGDSGGGMVFPDRKNGPKKWILEGIVSVSPRRKENFMCDYTKLTLFTKVGLYIDWIKTILLVVDKDETIFL